MVAIDRPQAAISKREKARPKVRYFRLRKRFKEKAGTAAQGETLEMAGDFLARAEAELEKLAEDYPDWVQDYIEQLYAAHGAAVSQVPEERAPEFRRIQELAHEMRGPGRYVRLSPDHNLRQVAAHVYRPQGGANRQPPGNR